MIQKLQSDKTCHKNNKKYINNNYNLIQLYNLIYYNLPAYIVQSRYPVPKF